MRKYLFISLCTIFCLLFSLPVNAQEANRKIGEGYTTDGIHYTYSVIVFEDEKDNWTEIDESGQK